MIRRERRDSGEGEERGLRKGAERGRDREKRQKGIELTIIEEDKEHRHLPLLVSSWHCVSSELPTRFCSVKRCSSEVLKFSFHRSCSVNYKTTNLRKIGNYVV